jgi:hypothetical protein
MVVSPTVRKEDGPAALQLPIPVLKLALKRLEPRSEISVIRESVRQLAAIRVPDHGDEFGGLVVVPRFDPQLLVAPLEAPQHRR